MKYNEFWYNITDTLIKTTNDEDILGKITLEEIDETAMGLYNSLVRRGMHPSQIRKYAIDYGRNIGREILAVQKIRGEEVYKVA